MSSAGGESPPRGDRTTCAARARTGRPQDAALLCARLARLYDGGAGAVVCDAAAVTAPGLADVQVLARLRLAARGAGASPSPGPDPPYAPCWTS
ncbi:hypothetical protein WKI68_18040 [Streptomyces sp. MS1.HAVA.3]|uniref:Uncharacterized protein n=1 Tax=Streptomyces caledonius TaxID=3134107 RepID=A0ABU8U4F8_9ACTN